MGGGRGGGLDRRAMMVGAGALAAAGPVTAAGTPDVLVMRFAMRGPRPLTTLTVGGKGPYLVLIDSGDALAFTLRDDIIRKLDLRQNGEGRLYGVSGSDTSFSYLAHDVVIGRALREQDVSIVASRALGDFDGVMPIYVLTARPTDLDFERGEIRLQMKGAVDRSAFRAVKAEHPDGGGYAPRTSFIVHAQIDGIPARLLVDTGAPNVALLDAGFVRDHGLWTKYARWQDTITGGVTGQRVAARMVRADSLTLAGLKFRDPVVMLMDPSHPTLRGFDGLIGIELLRRFTVGFDAPAGVLWLQANQAIRDPWPYDRSGLTWDWKKDGAVVTAVAAGSPAQTLGLRPGDELLGFASQKEALAWDARLRGDPDTEIKLSVKRDGQTSAMTLVLKDWL